MTESNPPKLMGQRPQIEAGPYTLHVFVCTNARQGKPACADHGAEAMRSELKGWAKEEFGRSVRINTAGCLDRCNQGVVIAGYPNNQWALNVRSSDLDQVKELIREWVRTARAERGE